MDNPTALEKARDLCRFHTLGAQCPHCNKIAAALKRAYAEGINYWYEDGSCTGKSAYEEVNRIRAEADQLEGK
jgi:hypothetical protein